jgi:hypothetical protein
LFLALEIPNGQSSHMLQDPMRLIKILVEGSRTSYASQQRRSF